MREPWLYAAVAAVGATATVAAIGWIRRRLVLVTVDGWSMAPTYRDGDRLLVRRRRLDEVRRGDVVVIEPPDAVPARSVARSGRRLRGRRWNVKRAVALPGDPMPTGVPGVHRQVPPDSLVVFGDSVDSADSRQRGPYPGAHLLGVVLRRVGDSM